MMTERKRKTYSSHEELLVERLKKPGFAFEYLKAAMDDEMPEMFLDALRLVSRAAGMKMISDHTNLNREQLYKTISKTGNPTITSLIAVLDALGYKLSLEKKKKAV